MQAQASILLCLGEYHCHLFPPFFPPPQASIHTSGPLIPFHEISVVMTTYKQTLPIRAAAARLSSLIYSWLGGRAGVWDVAMAFGWSAASRAYLPVCGHACPPPQPKKGPRRLQLILELE